MLTSYLVGTGASGWLTSAFLLFLPPEGVAFLIGVAGGLLATGMLCAHAPDPHSDAGEVSSAGRRSEDAYFRQLLDNAPVPISLLGFDGAIRYANQAFADLVKARDPSEVKPSAFHYLVPEDQVRARARLPELEQGVGGRVMRTITRHDGVLRRVLIDSRPLFFEGERIIHSVVVDVTEQEEARERSEASLSLLRSTLEATADGILVVNREREAVVYNHRFCEIWHLDPETIERSSDQELLQQVLSQLEDPEAFLRETEALYQAPERESFDILHFRDGRVIERYSRPQRVGEEITGRVWSFRDVTMRELAETALRESEKKFAKAFLLSPDAMIISRYRDGYYLDVNAGFERLTGFRRAEAVGKSSVELGIWGEADRARFLAALEAGGRATDLEVEISTRDGRRRTCLVSAEKLDLGGEACLITIARDVTEKITAERALRASEEKFARAFRSSPDAISISRLRDGLFLEVNEGFAKISGYTREEAVGKTAPELGIWSPDDRQRMVEALERDGHIRNMPFQFEMHDGEVRHFRVSAEIFELHGEPCLVAISRDVTDQIRAEEALRTREAQLRTTVTNAPIILFALDRDGIFTLSEGKGLATLGLAPGEVVGQSAFALYADYPDVVENLRRTLAGEEQTWVADLGAVVFETTTTPLRDASGAVIGVIGVGTDITAKVQAEAERERLIEELEARNAELERFTYTVSHDLRTPLVTIKNFIGLLFEDAAEGNQERMHQDMLFIDRAADRMGRLLDELLELSRAGRMVDKKPGVSLAAVAREAAQAVAGKTRLAGVEVVIAPEMPEVTCDPVRIGEVFQNLIDNAVRFMGEQPAPRVEIGGEVLEGGEVRCWVRDNGIGIDPLYHEKVFGLFDRLETGVEGTGIGLALVRRIAEAHGGRAWVESEGAGQGSTFYFTLRNEPLQ